MIEEEEKQKQEQQNWNGGIRLKRMHAPRSKAKGKQVKELTSDRLYTLKFLSQKKFFCFIFEMIY